MLNDISREDYAIQVNQQKRFINDAFIKRNFLLQNGKNKAEAIFALVNFSPYQIIVPDEHKITDRTEDAYGNTWSRIIRLKRKGLMRIISSYRNDNNYLIKELMPTNRFKKIAKQYINSKVYYQYLFQQLGNPHYLNASHWQKIVRIVQSQTYHFELLGHSNDEDKNGISLDDVRILLSLSFIRIIKRNKQSITFKPTKNAKTLIHLIFNHLSEARDYIKKIDNSKRFFEKLMDTRDSIIRFFAVIIALMIAFFIASAFISTYFLYGVILTWLVIPISYIADMIHEKFNKEREARVTQLYNHDCQISRLSFFSLLAKYHLKLHGNLLNNLYMSGAHFLFN